ncbi:MAG: TetR/AcrR family transcriptional regulator [Ilumatobacter sp.]|uniref:TetR/AcrR family transcriptional regulator n=1 Tax=Ilumatobacter sp. TaxID=1967498 RepID=UPI0032987345
MTDITTDRSRSSTETSTRTSKSRQKLLSAATELLVESGPRAVTVDAVADASGVAKSTLYRHWSSRDEMLVDVVRCNLPDDSAPDLSIGFEAALHAYVAAAADTLGDPQWSRILPALLSLKTSMPELAAMVDADRAAKSGALVSILQLGVAEGALPASVDAEDVASLMFGPLALAAITGDHHRVRHLAVYVVDRFIASYRSS